LCGKRSCVIAAKLSIYVQRKERRQSGTNGNGLWIDGWINMDFALKRFRLSLLQVFEVSDKEVAEVNAF